MKLAFILLGLFFALISVRSGARELTKQERLAMLPWQQNTQVVKTYMQDNTLIRNLSFADRLAFSALKQSCLPLTKHLEFIDQEEESFPDQTAKLLQLYAFCSEGTMGLTRFFIKTQEVL